MFMVVQMNGNRRLVDSVHVCTRMCARVVAAEQLAAAVFNKNDAHGI